MINPSTVSGRDSPIGVEFEDVKTATLLDLLNQISVELEDCADATQKKLKMNEVKQKFLQSQGIPKEIKPIIKEFGVASPNTPTSAMKGKMVTTRSQTLPELQMTRTKTNTGSGRTQQTTKPVAKINNELTLSAKTLAKSQPLPTAAAKRSAPTVPPQPSKPSSEANKIITESNPTESAYDLHRSGSTHKPFSVELGKAGRKPGYAKVPQLQAYANLPNNFDMNFVDLNDSSSQAYDTYSEISSVANLNMQDDFQSNKKKSN